MTDDELKTMDLRELIRKYGEECVYEGQGYTHSDAEPVMREIEKRIKQAEEDGGGAL